MVRLMPRFGALLRWVDDGCFVYRFSATARKRYWQIFQHRKQRPLQIPRQRAEARKERNPDTPLQRHPYQLPATTEQDFPFWETKGILRTVGSKSTFAYFSLTRKVGRRRQNTKQYTVGYRQRSPILRQRKNKKSRCRERRVVVKQYSSKSVKTLCFQGTP